MEETNSQPKTLRLIVAGTIGLCGLFVYLLWRPKKGARKPRPIEDRENDPDTFVVRGKGEVHFVTNPNDEFPIKLAKKGIGAFPATTVTAMFARAAEKHKNDIALKVEVEDGNGNYTGWKTWTWGEYYSQSMQFAKALISVGFQKFGTVDIIGFNAPEWLMAAVGSMAAGGKAVGIYTTNGPEAIQYIAEHSEAQVVVVENEKQLEKFVDIQNSLPKITHFVVYRPESVNAVTNLKRQIKAEVCLWPEFLQKAQDGKEEKTLQSRIEQIKPGHCCSLIYTSGTTGNPKAVMISHDNATWTARALLAINEEQLASLTDASVVSYLPLSHIAAQLADVYSVMYCTAELDLNTTIYFARPDALKGSLKKTLEAARPTLFFGVPRVWEKMQEAMVAAGAKSPSFVRTLATWAKSVGLDAYTNAQADGGNGNLPGGFGLAKRIVYKKVRKVLGLDRAVILYTGAAPISKKTLQYFGSLDIPVLELYGMSECTGPQTVSRKNTFICGSCGPNLPGCELKIDHVEGRDKPSEGEICFRGRHIMMGYMKSPDKTRETIDDEGWLHSGDVGRFDKGMLYITGRIKELIITAGGENIAPVPIEEKLLTECPGLSAAMMVGDKRKYNVVLVTLKCDPDEKKGGFTNNLAGAALGVSEAVTVDEAIKDPKWRKYVQNGVNRVNQIAVSNAQKIQKFEILKRNFSVETGELTATLKLKRGVVSEMYSEEIDKLYEE